VVAATCSSVRSMSVDDHAFLLVMLHKTS